MALAFHHLGDEFLEIVTGKSAPGRLQSFAHSEVQNAYASAFSRLSSGSRAGGGAVPAFAP